ncbi:exonuclease domain-containing protein [Peribacillus glennii]|uniref:Exonuclease domain-containing protein n=1 Tax=Peribacillus glennii TaxID=2303991 RepID=A0A372LG59_9BACI|nr:exonuclease domain-containing protein [Peribacillus glennii]RFU64984.1 hypothetical protein D0466_03470 [Peribacillus glennii]
MSYIIVDVERNSFNYTTDKPSEIIEIGAVKLDESGTILETFSTLVKPSCSLSNFTAKLTHITEDMVKDAPRFKEAYRHFVHFLGEHYVFVSWGKEDYRFFQADCSRFGLGLFRPSALLDIQEVYMYGVLETFSTPSLSSALAHLDIQDNENSHRALSDAQGTAKIFTVLQNKFDIHAVQKPKRLASELHFTNGKMNSSGKKKFARLIRATMKKTNEINLTWKDFSSHTKWLEYKDDFQIGSVLEKYYEKQFEKTKTNIIHSLIHKEKVESV